MINASITQGSAIGPASYVVTAADLSVTTPGNEMCKLADDTCITVPACNAEWRVSETWARANNLVLNRKKSREIVFRDCRKEIQFNVMPANSTKLYTYKKYATSKSITNTLQYRGTKKYRQVRDTSIVKNNDTTTVLKYRPTLRSPPGMAKWS